MLYEVILYSITCYFHRLIFFSPHILHAFVYQPFWMMSGLCSTPHWPHLWRRVSQWHVWRTSFLVQSWDVWALQSFACRLKNSFSHMVLAVKQLISEVLFTHAANLFCNSLFISMLFDYESTILNSVVRLLPALVLQ